IYVTRESGPYQKNEHYWSGKDRENKHEPVGKQSVTKRNAGASRSGTGMPNQISCWQTKLNLAHQSSLGGICSISENMHPESKAHINSVGKVYWREQKEAKRIKPPIWK